MCIAKTIGSWVTLLVLFSGHLAFGQATKPSGTADIAVAGQLLDSAGKPMSGVKMCLTSMSLMIWSPTLPDPQNSGCAFSTTDESGHFSFPSEQHDRTLLVFTDGGYVIEKSKTFSSPLIVRMTPWARLSGVLKIGDQTAPAGISVMARYENDEFEDRQGPYPYFTASTDEHGRFDFGRVLAGKYSVFRCLNNDVYGRGVSVNAAAGEAKQCVVPIIGLDVTGRIVLPVRVGNQPWCASADIVRRIELPSVSLPSNILQLADADRLGWYNQWEAQTAEGQRHLTQRTAGEREAFVNLKSDGSFMLADMAEGSALMRVFFFPVVNNEADYEHLISGAAYEFKVPAADGSSAMKPLDIGTLAPRAAETINAGQMVPDIAFRDRQGADHLLSQFRGKIVFLDFWGTWCGVCLHDLPDVKAINDTYGSNPHFSMISLSVGDDRTTWENFIEKNRMTWLQSCLGTRDQAWQARLFGVPGYPSYWIIGPDGKVLADGYHSSLLRPIIDQALKGLK